MCCSKRLRTHSWANNTKEENKMESIKGVYRKMSVPFIPFTPLSPSLFPPLEAWLRWLRLSDQLFVLSLPTPLSRILSFLRSRDHASNLVVFAMCFQVPDLFVIKYGVYRAYFVYFKPRGHTVR